MPDNESLTQHDRAELRLIGRVRELEVEVERLREDVSMLRAELRSTGLTDEQIDNILRIGRGRL